MNKPLPCPWCGGQPKVRRDMWLTLATFASAVAIVGLGVLPGLLSAILP